MNVRQVQGVIDENTLVWGQGLQDWLPVRNIRTLVPQIRTPEGAGRTGPPGIARLSLIMMPTRLFMIERHRAARH